MSENTEVQTDVEEPEVEDVDDSAGEPQLSYEELKALADDYRSKLDNQSEKFKEAVREKDIVRSSLTRVTKALKDHGIAEVDSEMNLIIHTGRAEPAKPKSDPLDDIDAQIAGLIKSYDDDDIETSNYVKKLAALQVEKLLIERDRAADQNKIEKEQREKAELSERELSEKNRNALKILREKYPDNENSESELYIKMSEIYSENKAIWNGDLSDDFVDRLKLAEMAHARISKEPKKGSKMPDNPEAKKQPRDPKVFNAGNYSGGDTKAPSYGQEVIIKSGIKDQSIKDSLMTQFKAIEDIPDQHYFDGSQNRMSIDI